MKATRLSTCRKDVNQVIIELPANHIFSHYIAILLEYKNQALQLKAQILIDRFFFRLPVMDLSDIETASHYPLSHYTGNIIIHKIRSNILGSI